MTPWEAHVDRWSLCHRCPLGSQRTKICLARGQLPCDVLFVGEAPGVSEDLLGYPFAGPAGHLLNEWVAAASAVFEETFAKSPRVGFTNLVACFPREAKESGDHQPEPDEIKECSPRLNELLKLAKPKLVVCVGALADKWVRKIKFGVDLGLDPQILSIVHPSAVLRATIAQRDMMAQQARVRLQTAFQEVGEC